MFSLTLKNISPLPLRERGQGVRGFPCGSATAIHALDADHREAAIAVTSYRTKTLRAHTREYPSPLPLSLKGRGDNLGVPTKSDH